MDMIGRIRRMHSRGEKSERQIARMTGLSRNTVSKWLHGEVDSPPKYRRGEVPCKLSAFEESLKLALTADARRPRQERSTARALYAEIKIAGYTGGYKQSGLGAGSTAVLRITWTRWTRWQAVWSCRPCRGRTPWMGGVACPVALSQRGCLATVRPFKL